MCNEQNTWLDKFLALKENRENQDLQRQVWKARHQRKLTDDQIAFFLHNCSRWDMLTYYACYFRRTKDEQKALDYLRHDFSLEGGPFLVDWYWTEDGDPERCRQELSASL